MLHIQYLRILNLNGSLTKFSITYLNKINTSTGRISKTLSSKFQFCTLLLTAAALAEEPAKKKRGLELNFGGGYDDFSSHGGSNLIDLGEQSHGHVHHITIHKKIPVHVPQPYPVHIVKKVLYPVKVPVAVKVDKPYPVHVAKPYPVHVDKPYPVKVVKNVPVPVSVPYKVAVPVKVPVHIPKPFPVAVHKPVPVVVPEINIVKKPVPVFVKADEHGFGGGFGSGIFSGGHGISSFGGDYHH